MFEKIIFLCCFSFSALLLSAQNVGVGTSVPDAKLEVSSTDSGILIPRIALTGTGDVTTVPAATVSEMVYNTATVSNVTPGFYYWNGTVWVKVEADDDWLRMDNTRADAITDDIYTNGQVGIGTTPTANLHINGSVRYEDGNQANGAILTSDANGNASWQPTTVLSMTGGKATIGSFPGAGTTGLNGVFVDYNATIPDPTNGTLAFQNALGASVLQIPPSYAGANGLTGSINEILAMSGISPGLRFRITFPTPFTSQPIVVATAQNETGTSYPDNFSVTVTNITMTGFDVLVTRTDMSFEGWGQNLEVSWYAFQN